jgi:zinc transport system permease protein
MIEILQYEFMQRAFIGGVIVAISCAMIGVFTTLKKEAIVSGSVAHASLSGVAIAYLLDQNPLYFALLIGVLTAVGVTYVQKRTNISSDAVIAMFEAVVFAIGIILLSFVKGYHPELQSFLFGSILGISNMNIVIAFTISISFGVFLLINYKKILFITFDDEGAHLAGIRIDLLDYVIRIFTALIVVTSIKIVGIVLVIALLVLPASSAKIFAKNFRSMIPLSIVFSLCSVVIGLISSYYLNIPSGAGIVVVSAFLFILGLVIKKILS